MYKKFVEKWQQNHFEYRKGGKSMENCFGALKSVLLIYPQLYPGYLMPEEKQGMETLGIGVSAGWILLFICISIFVLVMFFFGEIRGSLKRKGRTIK